MTTHPYTHSAALDRLVESPAANLHAHRSHARPTDNLLHIPEHVIQRNASPLATLLVHKLNQYRVVLTDRLSFRHNTHDRVRTAYDAMTHAQFHAINAPQVWAEERHIPRTLSGRVPRVGAVIVDLGCGPGSSTSIIARYAHPSWIIYALDLSRSLIDLARRRARRGEFVSAPSPASTPRRITPTFIHQSITEPWRTSECENEIDSATVDLVTSSGVVGHHLNIDDVRAVIVEAWRVLKPGGHLCLDSGPTISARRLNHLMTARGFINPQFIRCIALDPRPKVVARKP